MNQPEFADFQGMSELEALYQYAQAMLSFMGTQAEVAVPLAEVGTIVLVLERNGRNWMADRIRSGRYFESDSSHAHLTQRNFSWMRRELEISRLPQDRAKNGRAKDTGHTDRHGFRIQGSMKSHFRKPDTAYVRR